MIAYLSDSGDATPHTKRTRYWLRAHGTTSESSGLNLHLSALAYMSDNYFVGTIPVVHGLSPFPSASNGRGTRRKPIDSEEAAKDYQKIARTSPEAKPSSFPSPLTPSPGSRDPTPRKVVDSISSISRHQQQQHQTSSVGMIVSLDHAIYFHRPREVRVDDWLYAEMETPWAGAERGLVTQRIWNRHGRLVATCVQEVSETAYDLKLKKGIFD